ncbi:hypothetical protein VTJ83DRAFT_6401 [Remersonia thermophila]|uniref:MINDY deubiquitinase domain-containing protein n=1 Tax=Remersonia thermophila TaxID=72144 RepID=A0ABR4D4M2_9PEZI
MVARKPLPQSAFLDPAVPPQARDAWLSSSNTDEGQGRNTQGEKPVGSANRHALNDAPASLRPAATHTSDFASNESSIWGNDGFAPSRNAVDASQVPPALRPGSSSGGGGNVTAFDPSGTSSAQIPTVLRTAVSTPKPETNPFKRKMSLSPQSTGAARREPAEGAAPTSATAPLVNEFERLSVHDTGSTNPWQPALDESRAATVAAVPRVPLGNEDSAPDNVWASARPSRQPSPARGPTGSPALVSLPSEGSAIWDEVPKTTGPPPPPMLITTADEDLLGDSHAWDDLGARDKGKDAAPPPPEKGISGADDWNLIDIDARPASPLQQGAGGNADGGNASGDHTKEDNAAKSLPSQQSAPSTQPNEPPRPPPRSTPEQAPRLSPRPVDKSETYQIKNITWYDATAAKNPRQSPILVQNANGPCPLLALVNALTLTTPVDLPNTGLLDILRSREQVSLGLLLDAVLEELMRRTPPDGVLPDMTELYDFLTGLHTGMNVNPRFLPTEQVVESFKRESRTDSLQPTDSVDRIPGTFEHTKEMSLYSTFCVPLIHGWLPSRDEPVYEAFARHAASYEDAQNLLFREEELDEKLCDPQRGLNEEEEQLYQDVMTIKQFLASSATQLTPFGLDVIKQAMKPGSVAILFRNDHFSTLYRHPQTLELLTLVTDAGYAGHVEVVWESLVDVTGESAEFFSGDFLVVGGASHGANAGASGPAETAGGEWATVQGRRGRTQHGRPNDPSPAATSPTGRPSQPPISPQHEQEDRDLALALQLQEEEDARARAAQERRHRESLLSERYIEQQARGNARRNPTGHRRSSQSTSSLTSPATGRRPAPGPTPARPASASTSTIPATGTTASSRPRPTTQTVRSLLPPLAPSESNSSGRSRGGAGAGAGAGAAPVATSRTTRTAAVGSFVTHRPADEGLDDAPPSYEQAAKQRPYVPPQGHPSHPAAPPAAVGPGQQQPQGFGRGSTTGGGGRPPAQTQGQAPPQQQVPYPPQHHHHQQQQQQRPMGLRRGVPPPVGTGTSGSGGSVGEGKEKCIMM